MGLLHCVNGNTRFIYRAGIAPSPLWSELKTGRQKRNSLVLKRRLWRVNEKRQICFDQVNRKKYTRTDGGNLLNKQGKVNGEKKENEKGFRAPIFPVKKTLPSTSGRIRRGQSHE